MRAGMPIVVALAWLALLAAPAGAQESWSDPFGDTGMAPDVVTVVAGWDARGSLGIALGTSQRGWYAGDRVTVFVDTDLDPQATAEYALWFEQTGTAAYTSIGRWGGSGFLLQDLAVPFSTAIGSLVIAVPGWYLGSPSGPVRFWATTRYLPAATSGPFDERAPDSGAYLVRRASATAGASGPGAPAPTGTVAPPAAAAPPPATAPALGAAAARSAARRLLSRHRVRPSRLSCRPVSRTRRRCAVSGRGGGWRYRGTVSVQRIGSDGMTVVFRGTKRRGGVARRVVWRA